MPRSSSPTFDSDNDSDGLEDLDITILPPAAAPRPQKRTHDDMSAGNDGATPAVNPNIIAGVKNLAKRLRLTNDQILDVESFLNDTAIGRQGREYVAVLHATNEIKKIVKSQGQWEPSASLKKNIKHYVDAASLSSHLRSFLSTKTIQAVVSKLLNLGLDLPENIQQNQAFLDILTKAVGEAFTQRRSTMKKAVRASLGSMSAGKPSRYTAHLNDACCDNVYELALALSKNTKCKVDAQLCARAAMLRRVYKKYPNENFWDKVDKMLVDICTKGDHEPKKIAALVQAILDKDRKTYGIDDYQIRDEEHSEAQMEMDQILEAQMLADGEGENEPGPEQGGASVTPTRNTSPNQGDNQGDDQSGNGTADNGGTAAGSTS